MRNEKEETAIKKAANEIDAEAHLFFVNADKNYAIQYKSNNKEITARFFSAFPLRGKTTNRIILSRIKRAGLPAVGLVRVRVDEGIAVVSYERHLDREYGYRNRANALEQFFTRNLCTVKTLTQLDTLKRL